MRIAGYADSSGFLSNASPCFVSWRGQWMMQQRSDRNGSAVSTSSERTPALASSHVSHLSVAASLLVCPLLQKPSPVSHMETPEANTQIWPDKEKKTSILVKTYMEIHQFRGRNM